MLPSARPSETKNDKSTIYMAGVLDALMTVYSAGNAALVHAKER